MTQYVKIQHYLLLGGAYINTIMIIFSTPRLFRKY